MVKKSLGILIAGFGKLLEYFRLKKYVLKIIDFPMSFPPHGNALQDEMLNSQDPLRYQFLALAITQLKKERITGAFAEAGVYRGATSKIIHNLVPERSFYLFDTFAGFPQHLVKNSDQRFDSTSVERVCRTIGDTQNIIIRKGIIPNSFLGLEREKFAFVMLDLDLYDPTLSSLEFFYPRMNQGGYFFIHDYNSLESNRGVARAVQGFLKDKFEKIITLPDKGGSVVFRKM